MTENSFEYKTLRFLNDRVELYNITEFALRIALYDIPENELNNGLVLLREQKLIDNKGLYEKGLTITKQGQVRLQQMQKFVNHEKKQQKTFWERIAPILQTLGIVSTITVAWVTWYGNKEINTLKNEKVSLQDSVTYYHKQLNSIDRKNIK